MSACRRGRRPRLTRPVPVPWLGPPAQPARHARQRAFVCFACGAWGYLAEARERWQVEQTRQAVFRRLVPAGGAAPASLDAVSRCGTAAAWPSGARLRGTLGWWRCLPGGLRNAAAFSPLVTPAYTRFREVAPGAAGKAHEATAGAPGRAGCAGGRSHGRGTAPAARGPLRPRRVTGGEFGVGQRKIFRVVSCRVLISCPLPHDAQVGPKDEPQPARITMPVLRDRQLHGPRRRGGEALLGFGQE